MWATPLGNGVNGRFGTVFHGYCLSPKSARIAAKGHLSTWTFAFVPNPAPHTISKRIKLHKKTIVLRYRELWILTSLVALQKRWGRTGGTATTAATTVRLVVRTDMVERRRFVRTAQRRHLVNTSDSLVAYAGPTRPPRIVYGRDGATKLVWSRTSCFGSYSYICSKVSCNSGLQVIRSS